MAVISKTEAYFGNMRTTKVVKFSSKDNRFKIQLPSGARDACGEYVYGETLKEVNKAYEAASVMFLDATLKEEKVIVITFEGQCRIEENEKIVFECDRGYSASEGVELELQCEVFIKQTWACPDGRSVEKYGETEHSISDSANYQWPPSPGGTAHIEVPWSKEREQFFAELVTAIQNIIRKLSEFTTDAKGMLKFINKRTKLLNA